jgi:hypothetical protein
MDARNEIEAKGLLCGRMLSGSKRAPKGQVCVWNANIITKSQKKVWFGDLNITKDGTLLKEVAKTIGEPLYVLREMDCRFDSQEDSIDILIGKSVWSTEI